MKFTIDSSDRPYLSVGYGEKFCPTAGRETIIHNEKFGVVEFDPERFGSQLIFLPRRSDMTPYSARSMLREKGLLPLNATMCDFLVEHPEAFPEAWKSQRSQARWFNRMFPDLGRKEFAPTILFLGTHIEDRGGMGQWVRTLQWVVSYDCAGVRHEGPKRSIREVDAILTLEGPETNYIEPHEAIAYLTEVGES